MGNVTERVTEQSRQLRRTIFKSISGLAFVSVFFFTAATGIHVEGKFLPEAQRAQGATGQAQEFYVALSTDERDQPA